MRVGTPGVGAPKNGEARSKNGGERPTQGSEPERLWSGATWLGLGLGFGLEP